MKNVFSPRVLSAMERAASYAAADSRKDAKQASDDMKAVKAAFDAFMTKADFAERRAIVDTLIKFAPMSAAARFERVIDRINDEEEKAQMAAERRAEAEAKAQAEAMAAQPQTDSPKPEDDAPAAAPKGSKKDDSPAQGEPAPQA